MSPIHLWILFWLSKSVAPRLPYKWASTGFVCEADVYWSKLEYTRGTTVIRSLNPVSNCSNLYSDHTPTFWSAVPNNTSVPSTALQQSPAQVKGMIRNWYSYTGTKCTWWHSQSPYKDLDGHTANYLQEAIQWKTSQRSETMDTMPGYQRLWLLEDEEVFAEVASIVEG